MINPVQNSRIAYLDSLLGYNVPLLQSNAPQNIDHPIDPVIEGAKVLLKESRDLLGELRFENGLTENHFSDSEIERRDAEVRLTDADIRIKKQIVFDFVERVFGDRPCLPLLSRSHTLWLEEVEIRRGFQTVIQYLNRDRLNVALIATQRIQVLKGKIAELEGSCSRLQTEKSAAEGNINERDLQIKDLRNQIEILQGERNELSQLFSDAKKINKELSDWVEVANPEIRALRDRCSQLALKNKSESDELARVDQLFQKAQKALEVANQNNSRMLKDNKHLKRINDSLSKEVRDLTNSKKEIRNRADKDLVKCKIEINDAKKQNKIIIIVGVCFVAIMAMYTYFNVIKNDFD